MVHTIDMHRMLILTGAALLALSCQRQETQTPSTPPRAGAASRPQNLGKARVNRVIPLEPVEAMTKSHLTDAQGHEKNTFKTGEPIQLNLTVRESPKGLRMTARWYDAKNKQIAGNTKAMNGEKSVAFAWSGKKLKPGKYHVVGFWGGNVASEDNFTVTK